MEKEKARVEVGEGVKKMGHYIDTAPFLFLCFWALVAIVALAAGSKTGGGRDE